LLIVDEAMAVMAITLVWATSAAVTDGELPIWRCTAFVIGALVTSCSMVCTSVDVTGCCVDPIALAWLDACTRTWAEAEYCLDSVNENARLIPNPISARPMTHHFRLRMSRA
jgi:hypothetical protein